MSRTKAERTFTEGETVEVQPEVGAKWVTVKYLRPITGWKGYHRVEGEPLKRYINTMSGETTTPDDNSASLVRSKAVPTQRIRKPGSRWMP